MESSMIKALNKQIPTLPGIYLFKDNNDQVIYIGKAKSLKNRVNSYFRKNNNNFKTIALLEDYADLDFIVTNTEIEAMLLEAELIQKHKPRYNIIFKDGQPFIYILFTQTAMPTMKIVRNKDERGIFFGPFLHKTDARRVHAFLAHTFKLSMCNKTLDNGCLDYHLGNCAGNCKKDFDHDAYLFRLQLAQEVLKKNHASFLKKIKEKIIEYNAQLAFEKSKNLTQYLDNIDLIFHTIDTHYKHAKYALDTFVATTPTPYNAVDQKISARALAEFFKVSHPIYTIDCFDISHFQSQHIVGSCVRFTHGKPDKAHFRRFRIQTLVEQNDYAALQEIVLRRYKEEDQLPDLILIDGGKGQLHAVEMVLPHASCASLAKREEIIYSPQYPEGIRLDIATEIGRLLMAIRDYAHHFAISYHRLRRQKTSYAREKTKKTGKLQK
jgi:excinuclease ABC subunit C